MSYSVMGLAAKDPNFQARCRGSIIFLSTAILASVTDSGSIQDSQSRDLTTTACKNLCLNYCKGTHLFTDQAMASMMLLNFDVAADPSSTDDGPVAYQTKEIFLTLVEIG